MKTMTKGFSDDSIKLAENITGKKPSFLNDFGLHYSKGNLTVTIVKDKHKENYRKEGIELKDNKYKFFIYDNNL